MATLNVNNQGNAGIVIGASAVKEALAALDNPILNLATASFGISQAIAGQWTHKVDPKFRVQLPAEVRPAFKSSEVVLCLDPRVGGFQLLEGSLYASTRRTLQASDSDVALRWLELHSIRITIDQAGRIILPERVHQQLNLLRPESSAAPKDRFVTMVGSGDRIYMLPVGTWKPALQAEAVKIPANKTSDPK